MKLFDKRPLSLILCIMLTVFVIFANIDADYTIFAIGFSVVLFIFTFITPKIFKDTLGAIRISALLIIPTVIFSTVYFNNYFKADRRFASEEVTVEGYIHEIDKDYSTTADKAIIKTTDINGAPFSNYTLIAYFDKDDTAEMTRGTRLTVVGKLSEFLSGASSSYGRGYSAVIKDMRSIELTGYRSPSIANRISDYRESLSKYIVLKSEDTHSGGLFAALLIGEQDYLSPALKNDFKMIGISHILALSGMHLAIICLGLGRLLGAIGANRKLSCALVILFTLVYMAFTGFSSSVTRSGIMLILSSVLYLLSRTHDSVTSLFLSVSLICLIEPYAIFDLSLWLSAFATLGVLVAYEGYSKYDRQKPLHIRFARYILMSLLASLFAICATMLLSDLYFGRISVIAPISALIFGILSELYIYLGIASLLVTQFVSRVAILKPLYLIISKLSEFLADIDYVYAYTNFTAVKIMIALLSVLLILFLILNVRKKTAAALLFSVILISIYSTSYFMSKNYIANDLLIYNSDDSGDTFVCSSNGRTTVIDSKIYSANNGYNTAELIEGLALSEIDTYIMPVYYWKAEEMLAVLFETVNIKTVALSAPKNDVEITVMQKIEKICDDYNTKLKILENDSITTVGDFSYIPIYRTPYGDDTQTYVYTMLLNGKFCTYISSGFLDTDYRGYAEKALNGCDTVILGRHGKKYADGYVFRYQIPNLKRLIFNSAGAKLNSYSTDFYISENTTVKYDVGTINLLGK